MPATRARFVSSLIAAVSFLTVVPVGRRAAVEADQIRSAAPLFPIVGAALGAVVGLTALALAKSVPSTIAAALAVALGSLLTGCLHLDGLADTADALGGRSRERALAIMRDHQIGTYGAAALIIDLLIKVAAVGALLQRPHTVALLIAAAACARFPAIALGAALPYARAGDGQGRLLAGATSALAVFAAALATIAISIGVAGMTGLALFAAAGCTGLVLAPLYSRWLGGVTGDTLGAATEIAETAALVLATALAG